MINVASSSKANFDSSPPVVIAAPSGIQEGDLLVMIIGGISNNPSTAYSCSGWTLRETAASGGESMALFTKVATSGDESATDYTWAVADSEITWGMMLRVVEWDTDDPLTLTSGQDLNSGASIFTDMDLTPTSENSLIIFGAWQTQNGGSVAVGGYAIANDNPSWTEAQEVTGSFNRGNCGVAWAVREETTSTGDFSVTDSGGFWQGIAIIIGNGATPITVTPTAQVATFSIPAVTVSTVKNVAVTPSVQVVTASIPAYTPSTASVIPVSTQVATFSLPAITVIEGTGNTQTPSTQSATFSIPIFTISAGGNVTLAQDAQVATFSIPAYSVLFDHVVEVNTQTATFSIPAYSVAIEVNVTPSAQVATFSIPAYTVAVVANRTVTPDAQVATFSIPAYIVVPETRVAVAVQTVTASIPAYSVLLSSVISPETQVLTFSVPSLYQFGAVWSKTPRATNATWGRTSRNSN